MKERLVPRGLTFEFASDVGHFLVDSLFLQLPYPTSSQISDVLSQASHRGL